MDALSALPYCPTCRESMVTENGVPKCFNCAPSKKTGIKPPPATEIPSEAEFKKLVGGNYALGKAEMVVTGGSAHDALRIMRNLPMPKDMKEFRQIQKIIKQLEKLVGENNG